MMKKTFGSVGLLKRCVKPTNQPNQPLVKQLLQTNNFLQAFLNIRITFWWVCAQAWKQVISVDV